MIRAKDYSDPIWFNADGDRRIYLDYENASDYLAVRIEAAAPAGHWYSLASIDAEGGEYRPSPEPVRGSYLEQLLKEGWGITIGLSGGKYWSVTMAQSIYALSKESTIKATNSGCFSDLDEALVWCKDAMEARGIKPDPFWEEG